MWIKRSEWVQQLSSASEWKVKAEMLEAQRTSQMDTIKQYAGALKKEREKNAILSARCAEVEKRVLSLQDQVNGMKQAVPQQAVNLAEMFDVEDEEEVEKMRKRIREDGAEAVLADAFLTMEK